jgi:hypothetical protein
MAPVCYGKLMKIKNIMRISIILAAIGVLIVGGVHSAFATYPTISFITPSDSASVAGSVFVSVNTTDAVSVQYTLDRTINIGAETRTFPYSTNWDTGKIQNGKHLLSVYAKDKYGNAASASVVIFIVNLAQAPAATSTAASSALSSAPVISNVTTTLITSNSSVITWDINTSSMRQVAYGRTTLTPYISQLVFSSSTAASITLKNLLPETTYYYRAIATAHGKRTQSAGFMFTTLPEENASPKPSAVVFNRNLGRGSKGEKVRELQIFLIAKDSGPIAGQLSASGASGFFGKLTQSALAEYQKSVHIDPSSGFMGFKTRAYINVHQ